MTRPPDPIPMFAHELELGGERVFHHVYPSEIHVGLCGSEPILEVLVREDEGGRYWGWKETDSGRIGMIFFKKQLLEMCFPYGMKAAIESGDGVPVRLSIGRV